MVVSVPTFSFKMRIQTKKLIPIEDNYSGIAHTNRHGLQIEKLLHDAACKNFMAFYAFYSTEQADVMCQMKRNDEGVFMVGAQRIYKDIIQSPRKKVLSQHILKNSLALSCFLCCPLASDHSRRSNYDSGDGGEWIEFLKKYYSAELKHKFVDNEKNLSDSGNIPGIHKQIPSHISSFVEYREKGVPAWWDKEFDYHFEGVNALFVYDARR